MKPKAVPTMFLAFTLLFGIAVSCYWYQRNIAKPIVELKKMLEDPFGSATRGFHVEDGELVYRDGHAAEHHIRIPIPGAHSASVEIFEQPKNAKVLFAKDRDRFYYTSGYTPHIGGTCHAASFELLTKDGLYAQDKDRVYYRGLEIVGADRASFEILRYPYSKDLRRGYIAYCPIDVEDIATWKPLDDGTHGLTWLGSKNNLNPVLPENLYTTGWSADNKMVYYGKKRRPKIDASTFEVLLMKYSKDDNCVYYCGNPIEQADPATFVAHDGPYFKGTKLPLDFATHAHDANNEFCGGKVKHSPKDEH